VFSPRWGFVGSARGLGCLGTSPAPAEVTVITRIPYETIGSDGGSTLALATAPLVS